MHSLRLKLAVGVAVLGAAGVGTAAVAHDRSRPFTVTAGDKVVTAVGTAFSVRVQKRAVEVTLVEGKVRVQEASAPPLIPAAKPAVTS